jgi:hypothetical protein
MKRTLERGPKRRAVLIAKDDAELHRLTAALPRQARAPIAFHLHAATIMRNRTAAVSGPSHLRGAMGRAIGCNGHGSVILVPAFSQHETC